MSFNALLRGICSVLEIILSPRIESLGMREITEWKSSRSSHSIFPFLEDRFSHSNYVLETRIPQNLHLEVSIRMFRRRIKDAPFLHLLRLIFHMYTSLDLLIGYPLRGQRNSLSVLVWNFYMYEMELSVMPFWKQFSSLRLRYFINILDHTNLSQKQNQVGRYSLIESKNYFHLARNYYVHYGRYENHSLLILRGTKDLAKRWIYYILKFAEFHCHQWLHCYRMSLKRLSTDCVLFLGYILSIQSRINEVRVETMKNSYITASIVNESFFRTPILLLIKSMQRDSFCDSSGRPVSRSAWTTLTDDEILRRFVQIWKMLSMYYSGSKNRDSLYTLRYILQFSCGKTLACKHKSTIRMIRRRFDLRMFLRTFSLSGDSKLRLFVEPNDLSKNQRFWYLNLETIQFLFIYNILQVICSNKLN
uniref:Maturase K n=1 Tax=Trichomanes trollii TaxID=1481379 RepID=A0A410YEM1_9MONI|nr:maturase K [Trichomanes trollii]QAV57637.1 maturase K [Trichomanes trollii]